MSIGAEAEASAVSRPGDGDPSPAGDVESFVERARALSGRDLINVAGQPAPAAARAKGFKPSPAMIAATVAVVLGGGFIAGAQVVVGRSGPVAPLAQAGPPPETTAQMLHRVEDQVHTLKLSLDSMRTATESSRQDEAIRGLKKSVDVLKQDLEVAKAGNAGAVSQLSTKIDKLDRDPTAKLAEISTRLDRLDKAGQAPNPKLAEIATRLDQMKTDPGGAKLGEITARLERIERSIASPITTASVPAPPRAAPVPVSISPSPKVIPPAVVAAAEPRLPAAPPRPAKLEGWMLRDVYGGVALLEGRSGGLREVAPGQFVPGVGEIRSIERRGRSWVVVTNRGIIEADSRW